MDLHDRTCFGFGALRNGLIQIAYTVPDLDAAIRYWTDVMKVGPWYVAKDFSGIDPLYHSEPCRALINAALAFVGSMQIELIELANQEPGIHRDAILATGHGFHHFGQACTDIGAERRRYEALGYRMTFEAVMPSGDQVYFMEPPSGGPAGLVELIEAGAGIDAVFTKIWARSLGWDGTRPVRPFAELFA